MKRKSEGEYVATVPDLREFNAGKYAFETFQVEIERNKGTQFDPKIADIFLRLIDEGKIEIREN